MVKTEDTAAWAARSASGRGRLQPFAAGDNFLPAPVQVLLEDSQSPRGDKSTGYLHMLIRGNPPDSSRKFSIDPVDGGSWLTNAWRLERKDY